MIVSASYKTDIPTFYGKWFMNRLRAGYCKYLNPYNRKVCSVSLRREDTDGFVFWTKNVAPFEKYLPEIRDRGYPFVVQHTINGYPQVLEQRVVDWQKAVEAVKRVAAAFGPDVCVWRYDTVIFSNLTPFGFHVQQFEKIATGLRGCVDEVVISFVQLYEKTKRNIGAAADGGLEFLEPGMDEKKRLVSEFVAIATPLGIRVSVCSQPEYVVDGAFEARCVDAPRLVKIGQTQFSSTLKGNRKECGCFESRDIGEYDTCPHGCVYCYAVKNRELALKRFSQHDPESEFLFAPNLPETSQLSLL